MTGMAGVADTTYLAGDFSGIQRFVLRVKTAGKAQAKRLRARSFFLELLEHAALSVIRTRFDVPDDDVLVRGGGGFLVRVSVVEGSSSFDELSASLQTALWDEFGGQIQFSLGWGATAADARVDLEGRKRMPGTRVLQREGGWDPGRLSQPPLGEPCGVCGDFRGSQVLEDDDGEILHCRTCLETRRIGQDLTRREWTRVGGDHLTVLGVDFELLMTRQPGAWRVGRWVPRDPTTGSPLTFEELSRRTRGDSQLAVLKADVDDMGKRVGEVATADPSYRRLQAFSRELHAFFGDHLREFLERHWSLIYTLYAGGDDLLLVGPWDLMLDFAGALVHEFRTGPAASHDRLTLSAGIALTPYRVPIRYAVKRAETLLEHAKARPGKNRCATLGGDWTWDRHGDIVADGKMIADSASRGVARGLLQRLLRLAEATAPQDRELRAARWSYQVSRNVPRHGGGSVAGFQRWAQRALGRLDARDDQRMKESAASLRYALLATRRGTGGRDG